MALLNYVNLTGVDPDKLLEEVFGGLKPFHDYLIRTKCYLESDDAVLRLAWKPSDSAGKEGYAVDLCEPDDMPNVPESTFRSFLDDDVREVYESEALAEVEAAPEHRLRRVACYRFREEQKRILGREADNNRLILERKPIRLFLLLRPDTRPIRKQLDALAWLRDCPAPEHIPLLRLFEAKDCAALPGWPRWCRGGTGCFYRTGTKLRNGWPHLSHPLCEDQRKNESNRNEGRWQLARVHYGEEGIPENWRKTSS